jgi:hypothetical protein
MLGKLETLPSGPKGPATPSHQNAQCPWSIVIPYDDWESRAPVYNMWKISSTVSAMRRAIFRKVRDRERQKAILGRDRSSNW